LNGKKEKKEGNCGKTIFPLEFVVLVDVVVAVAVIVAVVVDAVIL
jgi:hypothetical protein